MFELSGLTGRIESWWSGAGGSTVVPRSARIEWLTPAWRQRASRFLDQQFWCFGQDIQQPPRNALVEMGFTRHASHRNRKDGSCYVVTTRAGVTITLWGFGVFYCDRQLGKAMLLVRDDIRPKVVDQLQTPLGVWDPHELPYRDVCESECVVVSTILADLLSWFAKYENWVAKNRPTCHRDKSLLEWKKVAVPASRTTDVWQSLADEMRVFSMARRATA